MLPLPDGTEELWSPDYREPVALPLAADPRHRAVTPEITIRGTAP
ncbi:hypothetical protein Misp01_15870 [Microtetraspora sp. NBRC 13810]|nr:hypothetical protein Misp01_15870 [Microtetraspora sp. NBRC 13810]